MIYFRHQKSARELCLLESFLHPEWVVLERIVKAAHICESPLSKLMVFACSDSRVCPSRVLDFKPGETFVVRNIQAALDDLKLVCEKDDGLAKMAVEMIRKVTSELEATMNKESDLPGKLKSRFLTFQENVERNPSLYGPLKEGQWPKESVNVSLANLLTYPFVREAMLAKSLTLKGGHYDFVEGRFELWNLGFHVDPPELVV